MLFRKFLRSRRLRKLKINDHEVIRLALKNLDKPTDLKEAFTLSIAFDLDTIYQHAELARFSEKSDTIVAMDIRLATLRSFCSLDASFAFQCLVAMPELLNDQRAIRSLHTYFNRLGLHEFAENLLGEPNFEVRKKRIDLTSGSFSKGKNKTKSIVKSSISTDENLIQDLQKVDTSDIRDRLIRYLAQHELHEYIQELDNVLISNDIDLRRRREILFVGGEILIDQSLDEALSFYDSVKEHVSDARLIRRLAQHLERRIRYQEAIDILEPVSDQTSQRLRNAIKERHHWGLHGYDVDILEKQTDYKPIEGRILYHIHASINHTTSGYSTRTHHICKSLIENGTDLHVRTRWGYPCDRSEVLLKPNEITTEILDGVTYLHDPEEEAFGTFAMEDYAQRAAYSLLNTALEIRPAVIHAASNHSVGFPAAMVAKALGIPFVYEMRGLWALSRAAKDEEYRRGDRFQLEMSLERHVAMAADHVIVITDGLRAQLEDWGIPAEKISLAPNGVDVSRFEMQNKDSNILQKYMLNGKTVIGYVGSLLKYEGLDYLFTAVSRLSDDLKSKIVVLIVGDGAYRKTLEKQVKNLGINHIVQFIGKVPMEEVNSYYSVIDIAPFPRISAEVCEMISPLKPLEAMAMGSVVVASNVRAISEHVIPNANGILFEKENAEDLCKKLAHLLKNPANFESIALQARQWVEEKRDWDLITDIIASVYDHCENGSSTKEWQLDVLPAIIKNGKLAGTPIPPDRFELIGPFLPKEMENSSFSYRIGENWQLNSNGIALTPKLTPSIVQSNYNPLGNQFPLIEKINFPSLFEVPGGLESYQVQNVENSEQMFLVCDESTKLEDIETAISHNSILFATRTEHLHGYVGIVSENDRLATIFEGVRTQQEEHKHQRKENWRRLVLRTHPLLHLCQNAFDRTFLCSIDPLKYELLVRINEMKTISSFLSDILCQRVLPAKVVFSERLDFDSSWTIAINALLVNGIEVLCLENGESFSPQALTYNSNFDENSGLDYCLDVLLRGDDMPIHKNGTPCFVRSVNTRVMIIGHDLKFIQNIVQTWEKWGVETTLLKSENHLCDLEISDQELMDLMASHDVIFCEWALGNTTKISKLRGKRPIFVRYHAQEARTEYLVDTEFIPNDRVSYVSGHTMEAETRLPGFVEQIVVPNAVDTIKLNVESNNPIGFGLMGITPMSKGLHRAVEILKHSIQENACKRLTIKGKLPKEYPWMKLRDYENKWYSKIFEDNQQLFADNNILQEGFTDDVGNFISSIQAILSVSDHESFHLAPLEAACGRTLVHMLHWPGSGKIHKRDWIYDGKESMIENYLRSLNRGDSYEIGSENRNFVMKNYEHRDVSMRLLEAATTTTCTRETRIPHIKPINFISNLFPKSYGRGPQMKIESLTHQENDISPRADALLRGKLLSNPSSVILSHFVDLNLIDGSAIWYTSMANMLSMANQHVVCILTNSPLSSPILQPIIGNENITFITPEDMGKTNYGRKIDYEAYVNIVSEIHDWYNREAPVFCRGFELAKDLVRNDIKNLWCYLTDYYSHDHKGKAIVKEETGNLISQICSNGGKILCQTSLILNELKEISSATTDSFAMLPPIIPEYKSKSQEIDEEYQKISLIYAGKIAPLWGVEELIDSSDLDYQVTIIGDKIHNGPASDSMFKSRLSGKLRNERHITWIPRLPRSDVIELVSTTDIAWCARNQFFENQTRELSTKVLECLLAGTPPIVVKSKLHLELLGEDWPFFVESPTDLSWKQHTIEKLRKANKKMPDFQKYLERHKLENISKEYSKLLN